MSMAGNPLPQPAVRSSQPSYDLIKITGLEAHGYHGCYEQERKHGQIFSADVYLYVDTRAAALADDLRKSIDYTSVAALVVAELTGPPVSLLESLAGRIATKLLQSYPAVEVVRVTVHKPDAPLGVRFADVEITIDREQAELPSLLALLGAVPPGPIPAGMAGAELSLVTNIGRGVPAQPVDDGYPLEIDVAEDDIVTGEVVHYPLTLWRGGQPPVTEPESEPEPQAVEPEQVQPVVEPWGLVEAEPEPNEEKPVKAPPSAQIQAEEAPEQANITRIRRQKEELRLGAERPRRAVLALGANIGDAVNTLRKVVDELLTYPEIEVLAVAPLVRCEPVIREEQARQPDYYNTVVIIESKLSGWELLRLAHELEDEHGRLRQEHWGPRTLDIDIICVEGLKSNDPSLTLPHPLAGQRAFVLWPWAQVEPDVVLDCPVVPGGCDTNDKKLSALALAAPDLAGIKRVWRQWREPGPLPKGEEIVVPAAGGTELPAEPEAPEVAQVLEVAEAAETPEVTQAPEEPQRKEFWGPQVTRRQIRALREQQERAAQTAAGPGEFVGATLGLPETVPAETEHGETGEFVGATLGLPETEHGETGEFVGATLGLPETVPAETEHVETEVEQVGAVAVTDDGVVGPGEFVGATLGLPETEHVETEHGETGEFVGATLGLPETEHGETGEFVGATLGLPETEQTDTVGAWKLPSLSWDPRYQGSEATAKPVTAPETPAPSPAASPLRRRRLRARSADAGIDYEKPPQTPSANKMPDGEN